MIYAIPFANPYLFGIQPSRNLTPGKKIQQWDASKIRLLNQLRLGLYVYPTVIFFFADGVSYISKRWLKA